MRIGNNGKEQARIRHLLTHTSGISNKLYDQINMRQDYTEDELLQKMRVEDDQWVVRNSAGEVLDAMSGANNPHVPRPLKPLAETAWLIAFAGTKGVGISPGAPATDLLISALKSPKEDERRAALELLKQKPSDGVVKSIYDAMYGDDADLREAAFLTLWEIGCSGYKLPHPTQFGYS